MLVARVLVDGRRLVAVASCCCWLLLAAADCCWWLLLLLAAADCCCCLLLLVAAAGCYWLRLGSFCRRKSLRIFLGYWWFAAKTILQTKKSVNISRMLMICCWIDGFGEILLCLLKLRLKKILVKIQMGRVTLREEKGSDYEQTSARPESGSVWC